jgi:putative membrane protein
MRFLLRLLITAGALAVATAVIPGIVLRTASVQTQVLTLLAVALIFGVINAVIKPIVKVVGCVFYVLTLGLIALVVNALLLLLASWIAGLLKLPFHVNGFWPAFWGAIIISVVTWALSIFVRDPKEKKEQ